MTSIHHLAPNPMQYKKMPRIAYSAKDGRGATAIATGDGYRHHVISVEKPCDKKPGKIQNDSNK